MTWLVWRQHRTEAALAAALLGLLGACLVVAHSAIASAATQVGLGDCLTHYTTANCGTKVREFIGSFLTTSPDPLSLTPTVMGLKALPALAGVFLGAPLVAGEVERGTHRLAWTQSITRTRWLAGHVIGLLCIVLVTSAAAQVALNWVLSPVLVAGDVYIFPYDRFSGLMFDAVGIVPVAYTLFAVALGTTCGALVRRTLGAMVLVLVLFVGVRLSVAEIARPHYMPAMTMTAAVESTHYQGLPQIPAGSWMIDLSFDQGNGHRGNIPTCWPRVRPGCFDRYTVTYQPGDRFWPFQLIESGIYVALTLLLLGTTWLLVHRRTA